MQLKTTPSIGPRYWTAILIASMCGTNLGDVFPEVLKLSAGAGLLVLAALFAAIVLTDSVMRIRSEAFYWLAILTVRAAATNIADLSLRAENRSYLIVAVALAICFAALLAVQHKIRSQSTSRDLPPTNGFYWFTMLTAGALGTVIGDGFAHAFGPVQTGILISIGAATSVLALILAARYKLNWSTTVAYWIAVVAVRWLGTNLGDTSAFFLSRLGSMALTGVILVLTLYLWKYASSEPTQTN